MSPAPRSRDFADRKAEGTAVEWLLLDLLEGAGWTVQPNQANWDLAAEGSAARAYGPDGVVHLPDLEAIAPHRLGVEAKSKEPRGKDGSIGWDARGFRHAERWQDLTNAPVIYAVRDRSVAPVPQPSRSGGRSPDKLEAWCFASLHRLRQHAPERLTERSEDRDGEERERTTWYWPRELFSPLSELLDGRFAIAPVLLRRAPAMPPFGACRLL